MYFWDGYDGKNFAHIIRAQRIRQLIAQTNLAIINTNPDEFLKKTVTVDETWVYHFGPE